MSTPVLDLPLWSVAMRMIEYYALVTVRLDTLYPWAVDRPEFTDGQKIPVYTPVIEHSPSSQSVFTGVE